MTLDEALAVLGKHHHHGAAMWVFDLRIIRAMPYGWDLEDGALPMLTAIESVAVATALEELFVCRTNGPRTPPAAFPYALRFTNRLAPWPGGSMPTES